MPKSINLGLPEQIKSSRNFLFELVLLAVVCALLTWFIVLPKKAQVDANAAALSQYKDSQKSMADNLTVLNERVSELNNHEDDLAKLDYALPLEGKQTDLQLLIQSLADSAGVTVGDINISGSTDGVVAGDTRLINKPFGVTRTLQKLSGTISVLGSFPQLQDFLKKIEDSGRIIQVSSLSIANSSNNNLGMQLGVDAYYFAP